MRIRILLYLITIALFGCTSVVHKKTEQAITPSPAGYEAYVIKEKVNMRETPSASGRLVATLTDGAEIYILNNHNGWYQVQDFEGHKGYIRSDLVGPKNMSLTRMASAFVDSVLPGYHAKLFFDKTETYKIIYLTLPKGKYQSRADVLKTAREIGRLYQSEVYPGSVEIRVLKPESKDLFARVRLKATGYAGFKLPVLPFGRLVKWHQNHFALSIWIAVPADKSKKTLLRAARKISASYDLPITKTEIYFVLDEPEIIRNVVKGETSLHRPDTCLLYYLEDKNGEDYRFNFCK